MLTQEDLGQLRGLIREEVSSALTSFDFAQFRPLIREEVRQEVDGAISRDVSPVFQAIFGRFDEMDVRFRRIEAVMVTKDYLDDKLADLRGDMNLHFREHEARFGRLEGRFDRLLDVLDQKRVVDRRTVEGNR